ncbi:hypothetical protein EDB84DRAFT_1581901 [Lactarius hengduanensis]|nr:hypothetical protein EDB84DRAFT_1581901 [Lactarius hengduanensis]
MQRRQGDKGDDERSKIDYSTDGKQCRRSQVESDKTAPTSLALSRGSVHKPQHWTERLNTRERPCGSFKVVPSSNGSLLGSLLWIHGKPGSGKSVICSSVIQDIMAVCEAGLAILAYFYFDFKDLSRQSCHDLLLSLISQLSTRSSPYCDILHHVYKAHENGTRQPSDESLKECLKEMLRLPGQRPIFIILDALDECPDSSGMPSPRDEVLQLVKELVDLHLQGLHICATSRPEVDIRAILEPLTFRSDGYFANWTRCDIASHRTSVNFLMQLPETLDETYERILRGINKAQTDNARRLLQCLAVAVRPLRVEELAELLAFDFQAPSSGGIPKLKDDWRWDDQEEAVLSTCSSLIAVVPDGDFRVETVSGFIFISMGRIRSWHRQCLGTLLRLDEHADAKGFPLVEYAARHWVDHAQFEGVSSCVLRDGMDDLFDSSKPHFAAWLQAHDMDESWFGLSARQPRDAVPPLYYAALCGFYDLAERLIMKHPEQVNVGGGHILAPLPAALYKSHFRVADLLHQHGAAVDVRGFRERTPLHKAAMSGHVDIVRWLLNHGADANARQIDHWTPLHLAAYNNQLESVQVLLEYNVDINSKNHAGETPLHLASLGRSLRRVAIARLLLSHGANVDEKDGKGKTPFQVASSEGKHEMTKLLLEHGAVAQS